MECLSKMHLFLCFTYTSTYIKIKTLSVVCTHLYCTKNDNPLIQNIAKQKWKIKILF